MLKNLSLINVSCQDLNKFEDDSKSGGFLKTENILFRIFNNLIISDSFSNSRAVGVSCIDDKNIMNELNRTSLLYSGIIFKACSFNDNLVSMITVSETSVSIFLDSFLNCVVINSLFKVKFLIKMQIINKIKITVNRIIYWIQAQKAIFWHQDHALFLYFQILSIYFIFLGINFIKID